MERDDWILEENEKHFHHYGEDFNDEQLDWLGFIWDEYADEFGDIDWNRSGEHDTAWYILMSEVYGYDDETIDRYSEA